MSRRKSKVMSNGRSINPQGRFARLGHNVLRSQAYMCLTPNARALLVQVIALYSGKNNGMLWMSEDDAAKVMGVGCRKVARKAFTELCDAGLIAMTKDAYWNITTGSGRARCWRLTWEYDNANRRSASNEWTRFEPADIAAKTRADRGQGALAKLRKDQSQNEMSRGNSHHTSLIPEVERGNTPHAKQNADVKVPNIANVEWGNLPQHIAITRGDSQRSGKWKPVSGQKTCPTAVKIWAAQFGQVALSA